MQEFKLELSIFRKVRIFLTFIETSTSCTTSIFNKIDSAYFG